MRARRVDPALERVFKVLPRNPPERGEIVLVDDVPCRVTRCRVRWREPGAWTITDLRVKPLP